MIRTTKLICLASAYNQLRFRVKRGCEIALNWLTSIRYLAR